MDEDLREISPEPDIDPASLQRTILRDQVRSLYGNPLVLLCNLTIVVLVAFSLQRFYPSWLDAAWMGLTIVISARLLEFWRYRRTSQPTDAAARWASRYTFGAIVTGCLWGLIASVLLWVSDPDHLAFIAFVVAGLTAAASIASLRTCRQRSGSRCRSLSPQSSSCSSSQRLCRSPWDLLQPHFSLRS